MSYKWNRNKMWTSIFPWPSLPPPILCSLSPGCTLHSLPCLRSPGFTHGASTCSLSAGPPSLDLPTWPAHGCIPVPEVPLVNTVEWIGEYGSPGIRERYSIPVGSSNCPSYKSRLPKGGGRSHHSPHICSHRALCLLWRVCFEPTSAGLLTVLWRLSLPPPVSGGVGEGAWAGGRNILETEVVSYSVPLLVMGFLLFRTVKPSKHF